MIGVEAALRARIEECAREAGGSVGVAATHVPSGAHVGWQEDQLFPAASLIKVPILVALYREAGAERAVAHRGPYPWGRSASVAEARAGRVDLRERITYTHDVRVAGSGVLQDLDEGLQPTLRDLAVLMITVSDNTATDLVLARVTKEAVERAMDELGLTSIRIPLSINELLYDLVDMDPAQPDYEENRRRLRLQLGSGGRAIVPETSDRATPRDLCRLFELLESRAILDPVACAEILDICQRQKFGQLIPGRLPPETVVAHKTGSIRGVRNDAGVVYGPTGPYAVAICSRELPDANLATRALADLSLAIYEHFNP